MVLRYLYLSQQKYLKMLPLIVLIQVEMMRNFNVIQKLEVSPQLFTQSELNDTIRDLGLPKEKAELLGSRFKENNLLVTGISNA
jgi:hypothetical protein